MRDHSGSGYDAHAIDTDTWGELGSVRRPIPQPSRLLRPLRVAMFVNEFPALSETFVLNQITGLLDLGHDVTIFANGPRAEPMVHPDVDSYHLRDRIRYRAMPKARGERLLRAPGILARGGHHFGALLKALDASVYGREALSLNTFYWCAALLDEAPFDVIHCHFGLVGRLVAYFREIGAIKGKMIVTFHGVDVSACLDDDPDLYRHLFAHTDLALPISDRWKQKLIEHGCAPERIAVHRMGIDPDRFVYQRRTRKATQPLRVLTVGRLVEKKGIEYGLRAIADLIGQQIPVTYTVIGDGLLASNLAALARELKIGHSVDFRGGQAQDDVVRAIQDHDVLLAPSVTDSKGDQEGIPVTLMEAMASGLPVIASDHSGIPELVEHDVSGVLVAERDIGGLSAALVSLWQDPEWGIGLSTAARAKVERCHDIHTLNNELIGHYRAVLDE